MSSVPKIGKEEVEHISHLCRIYLTEAEKEKFSAQLSSVLDYMDILNEVNTKNVIPTTIIPSLLNVTREDAVSNFNNKGLALIQKNFPDNVGKFLRVPPVFEK